MFDKYMNFFLSMPEPWDSICYVVVTLALCFTLALPLVLALVYIPYLSSLLLFGGIVFIGVVFKKVFTHYFNQKETNQ